MPRRQRAREPSPGADYIAFDFDDAPAPQDENKRAEVIDDTVREHASARSTPWARDIAWHECKNVAEMLHREVAAYNSWIAPTKEEHTCRRMIIRLLQHVICEQWPDADVRSFGSQDTQLYLPQGDIDIVVLSQDMESRSREVVLRQLASCLRFHNLATDIQVIARAKVPIIKFVCTYGRFNVDISINQANGLQAAHFIDRWIAREPAIRPLVRVVKQLLQQRSLSEVFTGGLGSYSVTLLVLSFLQLHPKLQRGEIIASHNLGVLLMDLLELYGKNFGYDECGISVKRGGAYFSKRTRGYEPKKPFLLCIEDPHDSSNDISRGSFAIIAVRSAIGGAFDILQAALCERANDLQSFRRRQRILHQGMGQREHIRFGEEHTASDNKEPESLLGSVLGVSREMTKRRHEIRRLFDSGVLQEQIARMTGVPVPRGIDAITALLNTKPGTKADPNTAAAESVDSESDAQT
ncbi:polynucleotide adenylyltransferase [Malassezia cuniculi]|uniref:polynucleotide adenylyltransferase n=1 Tax=Malassezia cuniculi TaxID=948313 RepID=A0AAF0EXL4_9BASI|nr:polynucleotide adenylyltransferase [Malassezia cuniculi]